MMHKLRNSYIPEIRAVLFGRKTPDTVSVNLTNRCNLSCIYCEIGKNLTPREGSLLSFEDMTWVISEMSQLGMKRLAMCGGEPFLFPGLVQLVDMANQMKVRCTITSNGMSICKLDPESLGILKRCQTRINISLDSYDEKTNTVTRGHPAALSNALESIKVLREEGIPFTILSVISKHNFTRLHELVMEAQKSGAPEVLFQPVIFASNYPGTEKLADKGRLNVEVGDAGVLLQQLDMILRFEKTHRIKTNAYRLKYWIEPYLSHAHQGNGGFFFNDVLGRFYCREVDAIIEISCDGNIQACGLIGSDVNVRENREEGLLKLWKKANENLRDDLIKKQYRAECNACCNHFGRNMIASILRYPLANRRMAIKMGKLLISRGLHESNKKIKANWT